MAGSGATYLLSRRQVSALRLCRNKLGTSLLDTLPDTRERTSIAHEAREESQESSEVGLTAKTRGERKCSRPLAGPLRSPLPRGSPFPTSPLPRDRHSTSGDDV